MECYAYTLQMEFTVWMQKSPVPNPVIRVTLTFANATRKGILEGFDSDLQAPNEKFCSPVLQAHIFMWIYVYQCHGCTFDLSMLNIGVTHSLVQAPKDCDYQDSILKIWFVQLELRSGWFPLQWGMSILTSLLCIKNWASPCHGLVNLFVWKGIHFDINLKYQLLKKCHGGTVGLRGGPWRARSKTSVSKSACCDHQKIFRHVRLVRPSQLFDMISRCNILIHFEGFCGIKDDARAEMSLLVIEIILCIRSQTQQLRKGPRRSVKDGLRAGILEHRFADIHRASV